MNVRESQNPKTNLTQTDPTIHQSPTAPDGPLPAPYCYRHGKLMFVLTLEHVWWKDAMGIEYGNTAYACSKAKIRRMWFSRLQRHVWYLLPLNMFKEKAPWEMYMKILRNHVQRPKYVGCGFLPAFSVMYNISVHTWSRVALNHP